VTGRRGDGEKWRFEIISGEFPSWESLSRFGGRLGVGLTRYKKLNLRKNYHQIN